MRTRGMNSIEFASYLPDMPPTKLDMATDERAELTELLATLRPEQWETPSLCPGWRVRDVVAHMLSYEELAARGTLSRLTAARFSLRRANAIGVAAARERSTAEVLELLRRNLRPRGLTAALGGMIGFLDALIHHQEIRRPLGLPRQIPAERLRAALPAALLAPPLGAFWRARGLRLVATDIDWTACRGPELRGPAEPLLLALAGRRGVAHELSGPGQQLLATRIGDGPRESAE